MTGREATPCPPHDWLLRGVGCTGWECQTCRTQQDCKCLDRGEVTLTGLCAIHGGALS